MLPTRIWRPGGSVPLPQSAPMQQAPTIVSGLIPYPSSAPMMPGDGYTPPQPISSSPPPTQQTLPTPQTQQGALTFDQVENYWIQAGGNPQSASMAAAVADAESGLNPNAQRTNPDGTTGIGLWLTPSNGTPPGSTDPLASARGAVQLSNNGTDWTQWCSTWSDNNCGQNNGTYLGSGANALMSLQTQAEPQSYNVFGATPSGTGVGASTATAGASGTTTGSGAGHSFILIGAIVLAVILVVIMQRRKTGGQPPAVGEEARPGIGTHTVRVPAHTREVHNA
jgi:hypothetical protein